MGFFETARRSAAETYGANRAEKYGRIERFKRGVQVFLIGAFVIFIFVMWTIGQGGGA